MSEGKTETGTNEPSWLVEARRRVATHGTAVHENSSEDLLRKCLAAYDNLASPEARAAIADLETHRASWRSAIEIAGQHAKVQPPDIDDAAYWQHELRAFDRTFTALTGKSEVETEALPKP